MSQSLVVKTYQQPSFSIDVSFTAEGYFNATKAAKAFGKRPADWLILDSTQAYIEAVRRKRLTEQNQSVNKKEAVTRNPVTEQDQLVIVKQGGSDQGTWLHPKLGIVFARWLNVDFALWCDDQIEAILHGQQSQPQPDPTPRLTTEQWNVIERLIREIGTCCHASGRARFAANERIRFGYGLTQSRDLPPEHFDTAKADLESLYALAEQHQNRMITLDEEFITAVIRPPVSIRKVRAMAKKAVSQPLSF